MPRPDVYLFTDNQALDAEGNLREKPWLLNPPRLTLVDDWIMGQGGRMVEIIALRVQLEEAPRTGRIHWQGCLKLAAPLSIGYLQRWLPGAFFERARNAAHAWEYAGKEATRVLGPFEYPPGYSIENNQGERTDVHDCKALVKRLAEEGASLKKVERAVADEFPDISLRYTQGVKNWYDLYKPEFKDPKLDEPYPWQQQMIDLVERPADRRTVHWVYDSVGGKGKSALATQLFDWNDALILHGKLENMTFLYDSQPIVIFDMARTQAECAKHLFQLAEMLKNGHLVSGKYVPTTKRFRPPHVIFMANFECPPGTFSADRLKVWDLDRWDEVQAQLAAAREAEAFM